MLSRSGVACLPTSLFSSGPRGLQHVKESPSRLDDARRAFEAAGTKLNEFYMVIGRYDMIAICEAPDEGSLARALLSITSKGSITSETCRAFTEKEYREIVEGLS